MKNINVNHLLARYFSLRRDIGAGTPLGRDPSASRIPSSDFSLSVGFLCDIGVCLEQLSAKHFNVIHERWGAWLAREDVDVLVAQWSRKMVSSMKANRRGAYNQARKEQRKWRNVARQLTSEISRCERDPVYIEAVKALEAEILTRDVWGRAACGDRGGVCGVR